jgi:lysozyme
MKTSEIGISLIKHFESLHDGDLTKIGLQPKLCPAGIVTYGWGHTVVSEGKQVKDIDIANKLFPELSTITEEEADALLVKDLAKEEAKIRRSITVPLTQNQYDALVSYFYNIGYSESMVQLVNSKASTTKITDWFTSHYIKVNGVYMPGLFYRRKSEALLYTTGELKFFN